MSFSASRPEMPAGSRLPARESGVTVFPISTARPVVWSGPPPKHADVVVIGGGVVGVTTALFLARKGVQVALLEKGRIAGEQSGRNWGWIRQQGRDPDELPIMIEARRHWQDFARETNVDIGLHQGGVTYLAETDARMTRYAEWLTRAQAHGLDTRLLSGAQAAELIPDLSRRYAGALHTPSDMRAEPWVAVPALAELAARAGAHVVEHCAVRTLDIAAGRVAGVITETGRIAASEVVLAGGAWSALFLRRHGIAVPQLSVRATVAALDAPPMAYAGGAADSGIAFRARADGGYSVAAGGFHELFIGPDAVRAFPKFWAQLKAEPFGTRMLPAAPRGFPDAWTTPRRWAADEESPFERQRVLDPAPNPGQVRRVQRVFAERFPALGAPRLKAAWAGMIDTMPDVVPVVDRVAALPGLTVGTGLSGHGFGIGPGVGRVLSALVTGRDPGHDLSRFRFDRFSDGTPMRLGPAL